VDGKPSLTLPARSFVLSADQTSLADSAPFWHKPPFHDHHRQREHVQGKDAMGKLRKIWALGVISLAAGCAIDNSMLEKIGISPPFERTLLVENPLLVPLDPRTEKDKVFEVCYHVLDNFGFDIVESNRYDGRIETLPRNAPGVILVLKPGSPDFHERLLATLQTYRHRVTVVIHDSATGGMYIDVHVRKELEDLPRPLRVSVGAAIFRVDNDLERRFEVVDPSFPTSGWLYRGRDPAMEQEIIRLIKAAL
jgi:hypothetical protein